MPSFSTTLDTRFIDTIIQSLETIYAFNYINDLGTTVVDPASLAQLQAQIIELKILKKEWISNYNSTLANLNVNLSKINS